MSRYISSELKNLVAKRALNCCEYCLVNALFSYFPFHIEHIISLKHGGKTVESNLAYACPICNINKGSDIFTFLDSPTEAVRFYNPRTDVWTEHFEVQINGQIIAKTNIAQATIKILNLNHIDALIERKEMIRLGLL